MRAYIILDLGFGDAGKGLLTDFLARHGEGAGVVVRYNGGAQAGHNVVAPDGRQHTFSQFGSGTFIPGVRTFLSRHVVIHPGALLVEGDALAAKGVPDAFSRLRVSDQALVITPFHQAANRIRESLRGPARHGSCGVGVGETVEHALLHAGERVLAGDLASPAALRRKLQAIRARKRAEISALCKDSAGRLPPAAEWGIFEQDDLIEAWMASLARIAELGLVVPDRVLERWLRETETVVFEGAQGVLLDAEAGFHPYTTWSRCTAENALGLIRELAPDSQVVKVGVLRSYAVRHGPGPLPTETDGLATVVSEHNQRNEWQGGVRYGWFDAVLARYALTVTGGVDCLAVTHLDALSRLNTWTYCPGYEAYPGFSQTPAAATIAGGLLAGFRLPPDLPLEQRAQFTQALLAARPLLQTCATQEGSVIGQIEALLGQAVDLVSRGPRAGHVQILNAMTA